MVKPGPRVGMLIYINWEETWVRITEIKPTPTDDAIVYTDGSNSNLGLVRVSSWQQSDVLVPGYGDCPKPPLGIPLMLRKHPVISVIPENGE